ncbi:ParB/RepB/Spo0J family partition protein [Pacificibacter marinus]|uniref:Chromosome-partitioning protein ParB n=1 Tax=Pacificibacter marinus TaxID=658057 RepID=A0A1Y5T235_9RHOB|nr:ParB/RepB/Spo0J family partition protein [Pacificibacter marinus]SEL03411.1 chromosome segregation DNA-binding protein [Pacificibacter marinus]SLN52035.1 Chromosome-partitioning protein ParB [Pacificibacter marinus]
MSQPPKNSNRPRGLGRGLSALMADIPNDPVVVDQVSGARRADLVVPIERVEPNPDQPRRQFVQEDLDDLANSIREKGVIQPLIVRPSPRVEGNFEIVAGERRWRASQLAKRHDIPIIVREYDDIEVLEVAIIENIQRADLNSIEEAAGYKQLMEKFGHTQEKLAEALGKSRSHIANLMRLLQLPDDVQTFVVSGDLSAGHARALITSENPSELARIVVKKGLSVRDTEKLAKQEKMPSSPKTRVVKPTGEKDADTRALESDLSAAIGMSVSIAHKSGSESGILSINYKDLDDLDALCQMLSRGV